jgi:uridine phosphorylase
MKKANRPSSGWERWYHSKIKKAGGMNKETVQCTTGRGGTSSSESVEEFVQLGKSDVG